MNIQTELSVGEFLDKLTILKIKSERIKDPEKLRNIRHELDLLTGIWNKSSFSGADVELELTQLKKINEKLWEIEDAIRLKEAEKAFDDDFIALARAVYVTNDERADVKRALNLKLGSEIIEEKSYADYGGKS